MYMYKCIYIYNALIHTMCGKCQAQPSSWVSVSQGLAWYSPECQRTLGGELNLMKVREICAQCE